VRLDGNLRPSPIEPLHRARPDAEVRGELVIARATGNGQGITDSLFSSGAVEGRPRCLPSLRAWRRPELADVELPDLLNVIPPSAKLLHHDPVTRSRSAALCP
jgi:hypothetical protein